MDTHDKEFDELFRSKLDSFETEPSAKVWPVIAAGLDQPKKKIALMPILSIAASVIVLIGAGLLFIPKKTIIKTTGVVQAKVMKTTSPVNSLQPVNLGQQPVVNKDLHRIASVQRTKEIVIKVKPVDTLTKPAITIQPARQQVIAAVQQSQQPAKSVVPDKNIPLILKPVIDQQPAFTTKPDIAAVLPAVVKKDTLPVKAKHRIRSFGDLVNVLVAKVDKRKDKVIEFTADDDGESNITGINLGIIKIKKGE
jgi:hypothetical protein